MPDKQRGAKQIAKDFDAEEHHQRCETRRGGECDCFKRARVYILADAYLAKQEECERLREAAKQVIDNSFGTKPRHTKARDGSCRDDCIPCGIENLRKAVADA